MISSSNINSSPASYPNTKKNTTATNKTTGFASYLAAHVSPDESDATSDVNTTKNNSTSGSQYLTVRDGTKVYTYIVIGENFKILIGIDNEEDPEEEIDEQDEKAADGKTVDDAANSSNPGKPSTDKQSKVKEQMLEPDFMTDTRMFGLMGYYQEKLRKLMKEMQENLGDGKPANAEASADTEEK